MQKILGTASKHQYLLFSSSSNESYSRSWYKNMCTDITRDTQYTYKELTEEEHCCQYALGHNVQRKSTSNMHNNTVHSKWAVVTDKTEYHGEINSFRFQKIMDLTNGSRWSQL